MTYGKLPSPPLHSFGGMEGLRATLEHFYHRVFKDPMIGYLFVGQDLTRLVERELEWTARALGVHIEYQGEPLAQVHQRHPIRRGHFYRRNQLLFESIEQCGLSQEASLWWRAHSAALESAILGHAARDHGCEHTADESQELSILERHGDEQEQRTSSALSGDAMSLWSGSSKTQYPDDDRGE